MPRSRARRRSGSASGRRAPITRSCSACRSIWRWASRRTRPGFMGMGGKAAPYLHSVGNGALSAHFHTVGRGVGKEMREKAGLPPVAMGGEGPAEGGSNLSDDALLAMARRRG